MRDVNGPHITWYQPSDTRRRIGRPSASTSAATDEARPSVRNDATTISKPVPAAGIAAPAGPAALAGGVGAGALAAGGAVGVAAAAGGGAGVPAVAAGSGVVSGRGLSTSGAEAAGVVAGRSGAAS